MVYPNYDTFYFTEWLLTSNYTRLTTARLNLFTLVNNASLNHTSITNIQWQDFIRATSYLYPAFLQWQSLTKPNSILLNDLGTEKVLNNDFADYTIWTKTSNILFENNKAKFDTNGINYLYQSIDITLSNAYLISFEIQDYVTGIFYLWQGDIGIYKPVSANGIYQFIWNYINSYPYIQFRTSSDEPCQMSLFNPSVKQLLQT